MLRKTQFISIFLLGVFISACFFSLSHGDSTARKVYFTDFENVTKKDRTSLNMEIYNYFDFDGANAGMFMDDGYQRANSPVPHSGNQDVCLEVISGYRAEFNLMNMQNLVGNQLFVSVWLYLPADFQLHMPSDNWFEIANPLFTYAPPMHLPYVGLSIIQSTSQPIFGLELYQRDSNHNPTTLQRVSNINLPRGRWFSLQYYLYRDTGSGTVKVWLDDPTMKNAPIIDRSGLNTINSTSTSWYTTIAKIYHDKKDTASYRLWVDDLTIWDGLPLQPLSANVWTDKGDNSQLPASWGCLGSYKVGEILPLSYMVDKNCQGELDLTNPEGKVTTLMSGVINQGSYSLNSVISVPAGYWRVDFSASVDNENSKDSFMFCVVQDYVTFSGKLLSVKHSTTSGDFYQVAITDIATDPTRQLHIGNTITVSWNYSLAKVGDSMQENSYVEVHGGYVPSPVGSFSKAVCIANSDDYITPVVSYAVSVDPNGGKVYVDDAATPITVRTNYQWLQNSVHKIYAEPTFESADANRFIFSKWSDGSTANPRIIAVTGAMNYAGLWNFVAASAPVSVSLLSPANKTFTENNVPLTIHVSRPEVWVGYSLDGKANVTIAGNTTLPRLADGPHNVSVFVRDALGNFMSSGIVYFTVETSPQIKTYTVSVVPNGGPVYVDNAPVPITVQTTYEWLEGSVHEIYAEPTFESSNAQFTFLRWLDGDNANPRTITASDPATYTALWNSTVSAATPLAISLLSPRNETFTTKDVPLTLNMSGLISWIGYSLDGEANVTISENTMLHGLSDGVHNIIVYVTDFYANTANSGSIYFTIKTQSSLINGIVEISAIILVAIIAAVVAVLIVKFPKTVQKMKLLFKPRVNKTKLLF